MLKIPVDEYATPSPSYVNKADSVSEVLRLMGEENIRHIPVLENEKVVGIITERDINTVLSLDAINDVSVSEIMHGNPYTVHAKETLETVAFAMSERKIGSAIVVDDNQHPIGIFTSTDALNALIEIIRGEMNSFDEKKAVKAKK